MVTAPASALDGVGAFSGAVRNHESWQVRVETHARCKHPGRGDNTGQFGLLPGRLLHRHDGADRLVSGLPVHGRAEHSDNGSYETTAVTATLTTAGVGVSGEVKPVELTESDLRAAGLDDRFDAIDDAIAAHFDGSDSNVAVVAEPFAGREVLLEYADNAFGAAAERVSYDSIFTDPNDLSFPDAEVIIVDGCHYLYSRQIGGYNVLDGFLAQVVERDAMFVTGWNAYAWNYLTQIRDVEYTFPRQIEIPTLDSTSVRNLLLNHYGPGTPEFVQTGEAGRVKSLGFDRKPISVGPASLDAPVPTLNLEYITSRSTADGVGDVEAVVFKKLTYLSDGNPGVAGRLWERSVREGKIAPAYIEEVEGTLDVDDDEAFLLELILSKGETSIQSLQNVVVNVPVHRSIATLSNQGVVDVSDGTVSLVPDRLHATVEHLRGRQLIW